MDLYNDAIGVVRDLVDLKGLLKNAERTDIQKEAIRRKVEDGRGWSGFVDRIKEAGTRLFFGWGKTCPYP